MPTNCYWFVIGVVFFRVFPGRCPVLEISENNPKIKQPEKNQSKETIKNKMHEPFETFLISKFQEMDKIKAQFYENGGAVGISAENTYDLTLSRCKLWGHYLLSWVCGTVVIAGVVCLILFT